MYVSKCSQGRPCNNCSRRYPPVVCAYESIRYDVKYSSAYSREILIFSRRLAKDKENVVNYELSIQAENFDAGSSELLAITRPSPYATSPLYGPYLQVPYAHSSTSSRSSSVSSSVGSSVGSHTIPEEPDPPDKFNPEPRNESVPDIGPAILSGNFYPYPESLQSPYRTGETLSPGGVALSPLQYLPIENTKRNSELFNFCTYNCFSKQPIYRLQCLLVILRLSSYANSIDGSKPPTVFHNQWLQSMIHSPIVSQPPLYLPSQNKEPRALIHVSRIQIPNTNYAFQNLGFRNFPVRFAHKS